VLLQYMMFIHLYSCKKTIVHVSNQLVQVWSFCWVDVTNANSMEIKFFIASRRSMQKDTKYTQINTSDTHSEMRPCDKPNPENCKNFSCKCAYEGKKRDKGDDGIPQFLTAGDTNAS